MQFIYFALNSKKVIPLKIQVNIACKMLIHDYVNIYICADILSIKTHTHSHTKLNTFGNLTVK